jgi:hypothetical protein
MLDTFSGGQSGIQFFMSEVERTRQNRTLGHKIVRIHPDFFEVSSEYFDVPNIDPVYLTYQHHRSVSY